MMLDDSSALILEATGTNTFTRIGTALLSKKSVQDTANNARPDSVRQDLTDAVCSAEEKEVISMANGRPLVVTIF